METFFGMYGLLMLLGGVFMGLVGICLLVSTVCELNFGGIIASLLLLAVAVIGCISGYNLGSGVYDDGNTTGKVTYESYDIYIPEPGVAYVVHGDIDRTGTCHFKVFTDPNDHVNTYFFGPGRKIIPVYGTPEQIEAQASQIHTDLENWMGGPDTCPRIS